MSLEPLIARLDYLHLVCGMAWLFLGFLCRFGGWPKEHLLASRWLRWSVFVLALDQWIDGLGAVWTGHYTHETAAYLASLLPMLGLIEFSRQTAPSSRLQMLLRWGRLLVLAFFAWLACRQFIESRCLALAVIALPAAWVVLRTFTRAAREEPLHGRRFMVVGWAAGIYLVCMALVDPLHPLNPRNVQSGTVGAAAEPLLVVLQTLLAWLIVATVFRISALRQQQDERTAQQPAGGAVVALPARLFLAATLAVLLAGGIATEMAGRYRQNAMQSALFRRTQLAAAAVALEPVAELTVSTNDLSRPQYRQLKELLTGMRAANPDCRFVYVVVLRNDQAVIVCDSEATNSADYSPPGQVYDEASAALLTVLRGGPPGVDGPTTDRWGVWMSGYVPLHARIGNGLPAVLGIDIAGANWARDVALMRLGPLVGTLVTALLLLTLTFGYQHVAEAAAKVMVSERRYRHMFEQHPSVMLLLDPASGKILDANAAASAFYQYPASHLRTLGIRDLSIGSAEEVAAQLQSFAESGTGSFQSRHRLQSREVRDVEVYAGPVDTASGKMLQLIMQDVTERQRAEAAMHHRGRLLSGVAEAGQLLLSGNDLHDAMGQALGSLGRAVSTDRVYIFENHFDPEHQLRTSQRYEWTREGVTSELENPALQNLALGEAFPRWVEVLSAGCALHGLVKDFPETERAILEPQGIVSILVFPIQMGATFWGFIGFDDCSTARQWQQTEIDVLRAMAGPIGNAILQSRTMEELRANHLRLEQAHRLQNLIITTAATAIYTVDDQKRITSVNEAFCNTTGWKAEEIIGQSCHVVACEPCARCAPGRTSGSDPILRRQCTIGARDGRRLTVIKNVAFLHNEQGRTTGTIESFMDVTELQTARESAEAASAELRGLNESLKTAVQRAQAASEAKSEFLAMMSHEIRTPMNGVIGMSNLLLDTPLTASQRELMEAVRRSGEALLEIINDLLDFSKIESNRLTLEPEDFNLRELVDGIMELLAPRAQAKGLDIAAVVQPDVPVALRGDDGRLRQVLVNLLGNAIKFTDCGEVVLRIGCTARRGGKALVRFLVRDNGIGIEEAVQEKLFTPFTQADSTTTRKYGGTGLGLAISKRLVELMGGRIGVESDPGHGATFWFEAELEVVGEAAPPCALSALLEARVLVVDAHSTTREAIGAMLDGWCLKWEQATDVPIAAARLEEVQRAGHPFSAVVTDRLIPGAATSRTILMMRLGKNASSADSGGALSLTKPIKQSQLFDALMAIIVGAPPPRVTEFIRRTAGPEIILPPNLRILVAEDHDINRRLAMLMLEKMGCHADFVGDGEEAVRMWQQLPFDVILMDCQMPNMDGFAATREIRRREGQHANGARRRMHIIAMTANAMKGEREKCLAAGMDDYVSKPVRFGVLQAALARVPRGECPNLPAASAPVTEPNRESAAPAAVATLQRDFGAGPATELVAAFLQDTPKLLAGLRSLAVAQEWPAVARSAHSIAGSCGIFGLHELRQLSLKLEDQAKVGEMAGIDSLVAEIESGFKAVRFQIEGLPQCLPDSASGGNGRGKHD